MRGGPSPRGDAVRARPRRGARRGFLLAALAACAASGSASAQSSLKLTVLNTALLRAPRLAESSGAAMSSLAPGVVWTHNDSGDGPYLYATDSLGHDLGRIRVEGAHNRDWEDLAAAPCVVAVGRCLYVGDIGDNHRRRRQVVIYRLREPRPPESPRDTMRSVPLLDSIVLRYPGHPHDAEALAVTGDGTLLVITKDLGGPPLLFRASVAAGGAPRDLTAAGSLDVRTSLLAGRLVTGAAISPGDSLLAVRTYVSIHFFRLSRDGTPAALGPRAGITIPIVEPQGEGLAFDGPDRLILTSERGEADRGTITTLRIMSLGAQRSGPTH